MTPSASSRSGFVPPCRPERALHPNVGFLARTRPTRARAHDGEADLVVAAPGARPARDRGQGRRAGRDAAGRWYAGGRHLDRSPFEQAEDAKHDLVRRHRGAAGLAGRRRAAASRPRGRLPGRRPRQPARAATCCSDPTSTSTSSSTRTRSRDAERTRRALERAWRLWTGDGTKRRPAHRGAGRPDRRVPRPDRRPPPPRPPRRRGRPRAPGRGVARPAVRAQPEPLAAAGGGRRAGGERQEPGRGGEGAPARARRVPDPVRVLQPAARDRGHARDRGGRRARPTAARSSPPSTACARRSGSAGRDAAAEAGAARSRATGGTTRSRAPSTRPSTRSPASGSTRSSSTRARTSSSPGWSRSSSCSRPRRRHPVGLPRPRPGPLPRRPRGGAGPRPPRAVRGLPLAGARRGAGRPLLPRSHRAVSPSTEAGRSPVIVVAEPGRDDRRGRPPAAPPPGRERGRPAVAHRRPVGRVGREERGLAASAGSATSSCGTGRSTTRATRWACRPTRCPTSRPTTASSCSRPCAGSRGSSARS